MKKAKAAVIFTASLLFAFPLFLIPMVGVVIAQIPELTIDWLTDTVSSIFGDLFADDNQRSEEWLENIYPLFSSYLPEDYNQFFLAEAVSYYFYMDTGESMLQDRLTMNEYMAYFVSGSDSTVFTDLEVIGIVIPEDKQEQVVQMASSLHSLYYSSTKPASDGGGLGSETKDYSQQEVNTLLKPIMNAAAQEGGFQYSPLYRSGICQCVDISRYYLWVKYKAQSGGGNGADVVRTTYAHPSNAGRFRITNTWQAGSIFSVSRGYGGGDLIGHTGYVEKVDLLSQQVWITEAWGSDGTVHVMKPYYIFEIERMYPGEFTFLVPA